MAWKFATLLLIASLAATVVAVTRRSVRKDGWLPCGGQYPAPHWWRREVPVSGPASCAGSFCTLEGLTRCKSPVNPLRSADRPRDLNRPGAAARPGL
jgi:hypothetical protein